MELPDDSGERMPELPEETEAKTDVPEKKAAATRRSRKTAMVIRTKYIICRPTEPPHSNGAMGLPLRWKKKITGKLPAAVIPGRPVNTAPGSRN